MLFLSRLDQLWAKQASSSLHVRGTSRGWCMMFMKCWHWCSSIAKSYPSFSELIASSYNTTLKVHSLKCSRYVYCLWIFVHSADNFCFYLCIRHDCFVHFAGCYFQYRCLLVGSPVAVSKHNTSMNYSLSYLCSLNACLSVGAMQSYTWSLTYTVTTAAGSPAENSQQLPCMRSPHVPSSSVTHRIPVYPHREEHGWVSCLFCVFFLDEPKLMFFWKCSEICFLT